MNRICKKCGDEYYDTRDVDMCYTHRKKKVLMQFNPNSLKTTDRVDSVSTQLQDYGFKEPMTSNEFVDVRELEVLHVKNKNLSRKDGVLVAKRVTGVV